MNVLKTTKPPILDSKHRPLPYQANAVRTARKLQYAALFHEQGLGKTKMALDLTLSWLIDDEVDSVMVVTKKALVENWIRESETHTHLRPLVISQDKQANFYAFNRPGRLYVTHYEVMRSERGRLRLFAKARRLAVILDEAQRIKDPQSRVAQSLHDLAPFFAKRVIMTGTPVANRPYDLWSLIYFLDQGKALGGSFGNFKSTTDLPSVTRRGSSEAEAFETTLANIFAKIQPFTVRETKSSAEVQLPEKIIRHTRTEMELAQAELYRKYQIELGAEIRQDGVEKIDEAETVLKRLLRLVQVASNPALLDDRYTFTPCKIAVLDRILKAKKGNEQKTIVWTNFTANVSAVAARFVSMKPARVHGKLAIEERNRNVRRFLEDPSCTLLVATPGAAKEGLTLTVANHAIFLDRSFRLDDYLQAQDRIHRISQSERCLVEILIAEGTVDEWVDELLSGKQLAAALAQSDITLEEYRDRATYEFNRILGEILNPMGADG